jgi:chorismate dehydratase
METRTRFTVACVPYVNAIPLVMRFEDWGEQSPVRVLYDVPSRLPALIESGEVQAALVSSIDALRTPGRRVAMGVGIGSDGPVKSVRLFSKVPPSEIRTLAHDASSLTSNRLAQVILAEGYGVRPSTETHSPDLSAMLDVADACVLIGDIGMAADGAGLHVLDLGEEWRTLTGKPFLWAAWIGSEGLTPGLAAHLLAGSGAGWIGGDGPVLDRLIDRALAHAHWDREVIRDYYTKVMVYDLDERMLDGFREFRKRLLANGFDDCAHFPEVIDPGSPGIIALPMGM